MMEERLTHLAEELTLSGESRARIRAVLAAQSGGREQRQRPSGARLVLALAAVLALLTMTALALFPSLREWMLADLGPRAPYATEALGSCEDRGITIQIQSALTDGRVTKLYFTVHDPSGVFFLEDTDNDLNMDFLAETELVADGGREGDCLRQIAYDQESQTGLYVFSKAAMTLEDGLILSEAPDQAKLTMSYILPGNRHWGERFSGPMPFDKPDLPIETLETTEENGVVVLLPDQTPHAVDEECPEVYISSMGFDGEGRYHVRLHADPGIVSTYTDNPDESPFWVFHHLFTPDGKRHDTYNNAVATRVSDGWDYCLPDLTQSTYPRAGLVFVDADYSVSGGYQWGDWELTVPLRQIDARTTTPESTLILSRTKDSPPPSGESHEAQVVAVSVSPLSVAVDFTRPEDYHLCSDVDGFATACAVTFADGTTVEPDFFNEYWIYNGRVVWEFPEPIEPEKVVSVSLNGNVIPFEP